MLEFKKQVEKIR